MPPLKDLHMNCSKVGSTTGEDLSVVAREFLKYVRDLQLDPGGL